MDATLDLHLTFRIHEYAHLIQNLPVRTGLCQPFEIQTATADLLPLTSLYLASYASPQTS